jgi:hypothetical protein
MINELQYNKLLPFRGSIFSQSISGAGYADQLHAIYMELGYPPVNLYCSSCGGNMLAQLKNLMLEYEAKNK